MVTAATGVAIRSKKVVILVRRPRVVGGLRMRTSGRLGGG